MKWFSVLKRLTVFLITIGTLQLQGALAGRQDNSRGQLTQGTISVTPNTCESAVHIVLSSLSNHALSINGNLLEKTIFSDAYKKRVIKNVFNLYDPKKLLMFKTEYEDLNSMAQVFVDDTSDSEDHEVRLNCEIVDQLFLKMIAYEQRYNNIRVELLSDPTLYDRVMGEANKVDEFIEQFLKSLLDTPVGRSDYTDGSLKIKEKQFFDKLSTAPRDESDLKKKIELRLALSVSRLMNVGETSKDSFEIAKRFINRDPHLFKLSNPKTPYYVFIKSMLDSVETHTRFLTQKQLGELIEMTSSGFSGLGVEISQSLSGLRVINIINGGMAQKEKLLHKGDVIISVNGDSEIMKAKVGMARKALMGPPRSSVNIVILRDGKELSLTLTRGFVSTQVEGFKSEVREVDGVKLGYIWFSQFYGPSANALGVSSVIKSKLQDFVDRGVQGLVLDVRGNGGGLVQEVVNIVSYFISEGPVVHFLGPRKNEIKYDEDGGQVVFDAPVVVMVDSASASASEILSGALGEYNRALIVGSERTFGKGSAQNILMLNKINELSGYVKLTDVYYFLPGGRSPQFEGIKSDLVILPSIKDYGERFENPNFKSPIPIKSLFKQDHEPEVKTKTRSLGSFLNSILSIGTSGDEGAIKWRGDSLQAELVEQLKEQYDDEIMSLEDSQDNKKVKDASFKILQAWRLIVSDIEK